MLSSFIIMSGFGGMLRAILMKPYREKPINTFEEVINSNIPWTIIFSCDDQEREMFNSEDETIRAIMTNAEEGAFSSTFLQEV